MLEEDVFAGTEDEMALCSNLMEWCERVPLIPSGQAFKQSIQPALNDAQTIQDITRPLT